VVIDDALGAPVAAAALAAAERLRRDNKTTNLGQTGRDDDVAVLDASNFGGNLPRGAANPYAAITPAAVGTRTNGFFPVSRLGGGERTSMRFSRSSLRHQA